MQIHILLPYARRRYAALKSVITCKKASENFGGSLSKNVTQLNLFTESGYLMLVKSLTDDLSWAVQRELVNGYFKVQEIAKEVKKQRLVTPKSVIRKIYPLMTDEYKTYIYYRVEKKLNQGETQKVLGIGRKRGRSIERNLAEAGVPLPAHRTRPHKFSKLPVSLSEQLELVFGEE